MERTFAEKQAVHSFGDELLVAISRGDGAEAAVILRELFYLSGWGTSQQIAFRTNFRWVSKNAELEWYTSVPT